MDNANFYDKPAVEGNECNLTISGIKFSNSINGVADLVSISDKRKKAFGVDQQ